MASALTISRVLGVVFIVYLQVLVSSNSALLSERWVGEDGPSPSVLRHVSSHLFAHGIPISLRSILIVYELWIAPDILVIWRDQESPSWR